VDKDWKEFGPPPWPKRRKWYERWRPYLTPVVCVLAVTVGYFLGRQEQIRTRADTMVRFAEFNALLELAAERSGSP